MVVAFVASLLVPRRVAATVLGFSTSSYIMAIIFSSSAPELSVDAKLVLKKLKTPEDAKALVGCCCAAVAASQAKIEPQDMEESQKAQREMLQAMPKPCVYAFNITRKLNHEIVN